MKLSQWHDADTKPVHVGVYETDASSYLHHSKKCFQHWNGQFWGLYSFYEQLAERVSYKNKNSKYQHVKWRGLAEKQD